MPHLPIWPKVWAKAHKQLLCSICLRWLKLSSFLTGILAVYKILIYEAEGAGWYFSNLLFKMHNAMLLFSPIKVYFMALRRFVLQITFLVFIFPMLFLVYV